VANATHPITVGRFRQVFFLIGAPKVGKKDAPTIRIYRTLAKSV
jgi:hypothetical protein